MRKNSKYSTKTTRKPDIMQRYDSYKDSGVKWLGVIPEHWEVKRLASYFTERRVKVSDKDFEPLSVTKLGVFPQWENVAKTNDGDNRKLVKKGDFVINSRSDRKGSSGISDRDGSVSLINIVLQPRKTILAQFSNYLLKSYRFIEEYYRNGRGIVADLWTTRYDEMKMIKLAIPPLKEQEAIANYLDTATAKIDSAIAQQQKMIDLLNERKQIIINNAVTKGLNPNAKMKDSGVEWIGEVPEGWEVRKLKHIAKIFGRIGFRGYNASDLVDEGEGAITLSPSNMKEHKMQYEKCTYLSWNKYYESPEIMIKNGDVLFVKTGSTYGKSCLVENLPIEATINPQLVVFKEFNCSNSFFEYLLQSNIIRDQVELSVIGGTIPTISQEKILNYLVPIPSMEEQLVIVDTIKSSCKPLNEAIINANKQISLLQERKQIIINDVVTGKVKVG